MEVQSTFPGSCSSSALDVIPHFHIDDLLDFSNEDIVGGIGEGYQLSGLDSTVNKAGAETVSCLNNHSASGPLTGNKHLLDGGADEPLPSTDVLCVPYDDLAELEWLSKFVDDSSYNSYTDQFQSASPVSVLDSSASSGNSTTRASSSTNDNNANHSPNHNYHLLYQSTTVPGRARSKRARTGGRVWGNSRILAASTSSTTTDTESLSSDSNVISEGGGGVQQHHTSSSSALSADSSHHQQQQQLSIKLMMTPPPKAVTTGKPWKPHGKSAGSNGTGKKGGQQHDGEAGSAAAAATQQPWRCLHCATQRTPQWRAGPMGPKTLCNACGVRYKSGRLLPEYRPAGSPGYVCHKHSNSHKKILEMRRQKETSPSGLHSAAAAHNSIQQFSEFSPPLEDDTTGICTP